MNLNSLFKNCNKLKNVCLIFTCLWLVPTLATAETQNNLKIEKCKTNTAQIVSARIKESGEKMYVSGIVYLYLPYGQNAGFHVDAQLLNESGKIIMEKSDRLPPSSPRLGGWIGRTSMYAISFPSEKVKRAASIRVFGYNRSHKKCQKEAEEKI